MVSSGRLAAPEVSLESKRFVVWGMLSLPMTIQPKFIAGLSTQHWTSATISLVDPQV